MTPTVVLPNPTPVGADQFLRKFLESYHECRRTFNSEQWNSVWGGPWWNGFMMWKTGQPEPLKKSVLVLTAEKLDLCYADGEPLTLDVVFHKSRGLDFRRPHDERFPPIVVLEHENNRVTVWREVQKLLSVRSPLKVLITYTQGAEPPIPLEEGQRRLSQLRDLVREHWEHAATLTGREVGAEYLFIVGHEGQERIMWWYAMSFGSAQSPSEVDFAQTYLG
jgi:hypothetical protein